MDADGGHDRSTCAIYPIRVVGASGPRVLPPPRTAAVLAHERRALRSVVSDRLPYGTDARGGGIINGVEAEWTSHAVALQWSEADTLRPWNRRYGG